MMAISFISIGIFGDAYGDSNLVVVASGGFVQAAFAFESAKSSRLLAHAFVQLARAVPVANRYIALIPKWVVGQLMSCR